MPKRDTRVTRPDDKRLRANRPPERAAKHPVLPPTRYEQLVAGTIDVDDLDDEEIMRGQCRNRAGKFQGRPPKTFPRQLHDAMRKEFQKRINEKFQSGTDTAYEALLEIAAGGFGIPADARVKAATVLLERGLGKVPDKVFSEITVKKFEEDIDGLFVDNSDTGGTVVPFNKGKKAV